MPSYTARLTASGDTELVAAPGTNKFIRVHALVITASTATDLVILKSGSTAVFRVSSTKVEGGGVALPWSPDGYFDCANNEALVGNLSGASAVDVFVSYSVR